jgi:hypothetical protein
MTDIIGITEGLIKNYPHLFHHVNFDALKFNYFESDNAPPLKINGLSKKAIDILDYNNVAERYVIDVNTTFSEIMLPQKLQWMMVDILLCIDKECSGKIIQPSFISHPCIVNAISELQLGADFLDNPNLPDLFEEPNVPIF